jgi:hypothetical protein
LHCERVEEGSMHGSKVKITSVPSTSTTSALTTSSVLSTMRVLSFSV